MEKILITGGNGFIASHLKELLKDEFKIFAPNKSYLNMLDEVAVSSYLHTHKPDYIIHAAGYDANPSFSNKNKNMVFCKNMKMFLNLVDKQHLFKRMIYFGSGAEVAKGHRGSSQYVLAKRTMTKYLEVSNNNIYNLRLFEVLGEYADWRYRVPENLICKAIYSMPLNVKINKISSFIDIVDLANIIKIILKKEKLHYKLYDCIYPQNKTTYDFANKILEITNKKNLPIKVPSLHEFYIGNQSALNTELDNNFKFTHWEDTIKRLVKYYKKNKYKIDTNKFEY